MVSVVLLNLGRGNLHQGLPLVTVQIRVTESSQEVQFTGSLPPAPDLLALYQRWQLLYELLYEARAIGLRQSSPLLTDATATEDDILIEDADVTHVSETEFAQVCAELQQQLDSWLDTADFRSLERQLRMRLNPDQPIRILLQTEDAQIRKLPWYVWQFLRDYTQAEVALSPLNFSPSAAPPVQAEAIRILAVLGDASGIDVEADRRLLESSVEAHICWLVEPSRAEFDHHLWDSQGWDILFFAGHSTTQVTDDTGYLFLNSTERLTIAQLHNALTRAIDRGLQLAIFNSCEGLGLATQLADLNIPEIIVMREPVPDRVAQAFLKNFLVAWAGGQSLYLSVREARERLQGIEGDYPGASWLPVMFQNPAVEPLVWRSPAQPTATAITEPTVPPDATIAAPLQADRPSPPSFYPSSREPTQQPQRWAHWLPVCRRAFFVTALMMGSRWLGFWQPLELWTFDALMRLRPTEAMDERLLIVTIDGADKDYQSQAGMALQGSLADQALVDLINILQPHEPALIGLDIYRDYPQAQVIDAAAWQQVRQLRDEAFIDVCQVGGGPQNPDEIAPPPEVPDANVGFSDLALDPDLVVRRQILGMAPGNRCATDRSFSFLIAQRYLENQGIELQRLSSRYFQMGSAQLQKVEAHSGGYQRFEAGGFEVLANYRDAQAIAPTVPLRELLDGSRTDELAELVRGKIVLIGNIDKGDKDYHLTPYSHEAGIRAETPGVIIHAHMVSYLISASLGERPTLWWWPQWGDTLWVWGWSAIGGGMAVLVMYRRGNWMVLIVAIGSSVVVLAIGCFLGLWLWGGWLPLVPSALGIIAAGLSTKFISKQISK